MDGALIDFPHRLAGHCGSGALRDLIEFHGLSWGDDALSEGPVFGLGSGLGFVYVERNELSPPFYLVGRGADMERDLCSRLEITCELCQTDDADEGWRLLKDELDAGRPTMIWADIQALDYLNVRLSNTMHDVVVCGYDPSDGVAFVADNDRVDIQRCSLDSLRRARNSSGFPAPNRNALWRLGFPAALPDASAAIGGAIALATKHMREGFGTPAEGFAAGLAGVEWFASAYPEWPERFGEALPAACKMLRVLIVKAGTGGALFRGLHADFLDWAADLLGDRGLVAAAAIYEDLAGAWVELAERVVRTGDAGVDHASGLAMIPQIRDLEGRGVAAMADWLSARRVEVAA